MLNSTRDAKRAAARASFMEKTGVDDKEMKMVDDMADLTLILSRFLMLFKRLPSNINSNFAKQLFLLREGLDTALELEYDRCIMCASDADHNDGDPCTHGENVRTAIILMAMLRIYPDIDMDVDEDELPDPNAGMVES